MSRLLNAFTAAIAIGVGLLTLLGLLAGGIFGAITDVFLRLAVVTAALAIVVGLLNLFLVHTRRIVRRENGFLYSVPLLVSAGLVLVLWLLGADTANRLVLENVLIAAESALAGLLAVVLIYGAYRLLRQRVTWSGVLFIVTVLLMLAGALPLADAAVLEAVRAWVLAVPVSAGARGLLLGIALAIIVTGVRVLTGQDRPYRD